MSASNCIHEHAGIWQVRKTNCTTEVSVHTTVGVDESRRANMRLQIVFGVLCFCVLVGKSSSLEVIDFQWVKNENGDVMCGTSPPNETLSAIGTRLQCVTSCNLRCPSPCQAVNYRQIAQLCEMFYYEPCSYDVQPDCANYQVDRSFTTDN